MEMFRRVRGPVALATCLIMADHNRYSVDARAAGRMVLVRSHAERIVVLLGDEAVADHPRNFRRDQIIYDPWHYLPVLRQFSELAFGKEGKPGMVPGIANFPGIVTFAGGLPIVTANKVQIGGIGVSGGTSDQDEQCAQAGIDAVKGELT